MLRVLLLATGAREAEELLRSGRRRACSSLRPTWPTAPEVLSSLLEGLKGKCYGDRGYLSFLLVKGLHLMARMRKNMKNMLLKLKVRNNSIINSSGSLNNRPKDKFYRLSRTVF
ncbi:transposase [Pontibacter toksunensis]|uniref:Transposase n=1 Tax=Pontibacter toksunensis TaxID=1332631 RepID=A0ABW6BZY0_9BACT